MSDETCRHGTSLKNECDDCSTLARVVNDLDRERVKNRGLIATITDLAMSLREMRDHHRLVADEADVMALPKKPEKAFIAKAAWRDRLFEQKLTALLDPSASAPQGGDKP